VITGDKLISRRYHAEILYDPEENVFYLIQKKNEALKINDSRVRRPTRLNPYDIIQLGETRLVFVPLCSERFQWPTGR
jgi:pSer/pThr/pTyr-binding forkhead associated (FHA) protein